MERIRNPFGRWAKGDRWATLYDKCTRCGTTERKHYGNGLCRKCHQETNKGYKLSVLKYRSSDKWKKTKKEYDRRVRYEALVHYSADPPFCSCCGEKHLEFLAFDHINGGGNKHTKSMKRAKLSIWLKSAGYPDGFQILCHNCNMAKGIYGVCPHKNLENNE